MAWDGPALLPSPPRSLTACSALPPEGAGMAWDGPALLPSPPRSLTACSALPPEGAGMAWDGPALLPSPPRSLTACSALRRFALLRSSQLAAVSVKIITPTPVAK